MEERLIAQEGPSIRIGSDEIGKDPVLRRSDAARQYADLDAVVALFIIGHYRDDDAR
jgi:hypothetical protein